MSHEHGPPSVDLGTVKWIVRGLWGLVLVFVLIDAVWFGPGWLASLGEHSSTESHHVESPEEEAHEALHTEGPTTEHTPAGENHDTPSTSEETHGASSHGDEHQGFGGHKHGHYGFEMVPAFHALYGFAGCVGLVLAARVLRMLVMRDEDYYGDDAPFQEPTEPAAGHGKGGHSA